MTNNLIKKSVMLVVGLLCLFAGKPVKAQCPHKINNNLSCAVVVDINIYKLPPAACTSLCTSLTGVLVPAGATMPISCGACTSPCNIEVTVTHLGGVPVAPTTADFTTTSCVQIGNGGTPCTPSSSSPPNILYDLGNTVFKLYY